MSYVKASNGIVEKYPYSIGLLRKDNPNTSFPRRVSDELMAEWGVHPVRYLSKPSLDERTQKIELDAQPHQENGEWFIGWSVIDKTAEEVHEYDSITAEAARSKRDALLAETDWVVIMHTEKGTNIPAAMEIYRQALRDITAQEGFPHNVTWPTKP